MTAKDTRSVLKKRMTGDVKEDVNTLYLAMREFSLEPNANEIQETINEMINDLVRDLSEHERDDVALYIHAQTRDRFSKGMTKVQAQLKVQDFEKAYKACENLEQEAKYYMKEVAQETGKNVHFKMYQKQGEFFLGEEYYHLENQCSFAFDYVSLLALEVQILYLLGRKEESISTIHRIYDYDPVSVEIIFLEASIHEKEENEYSYKSCMKKAHRYLFNEKDFLAYFKCLSDFYFTFRKDNKTANVLEKMSESKTYQEALNHLTPKIKKSLQKENLPYTVSDDVITCFLKRAKQSLKQKNRSVYTYIYQCLLPLKGEQELKGLGMEKPEIVFRSKDKNKNALTKGLMKNKESK